MTDDRVDVPEDATSPDEPPDPTGTGDAPGEPTTEAALAVPARRHFTAAASRDLWRGALVLLAVAAVTCAVVAWVLPDDERVQVVEKGFTDLATDGLDDVTYGVVVENPTDEVAYHTVVCIELRLADADPGEGPGCREFTIEVMFPGQRLGIGALTNVYGDEVTGIDVQVRGPAAWEDPDDHSHPADADAETDARVPHVIEARDVAVTYSPDDEPLVSFVPVSGYLDDVRRASAYAIFRDADGRIIGGSGAELPSPIRPDDDTRQSIVVDDTELPDLATAEVYIFPSGL